MSLNRHVSGQVLKSSTDRFWHQSFSDSVSLSLCLHPVQQKLATVNVRLTFGHAQVGHIAEYAWIYCYVLISFCSIFLFSIINRNGCVSMCAWRCTSKCRHSFGSGCDCVSVSKIVLWLCSTVEICWSGVSVSHPAHTFVWYGPLMTSGSNCSPY